MKISALVLGDALILLTNVTMPTMFCLHTNIYEKEKSYSAEFFLIIIWLHNILI